MKAGVQTYNDVLARNGIAPIAADGCPAEPMAAARRLFINGCPGLEFPGYQPPANAEFVGHLRPVRNRKRSPIPLPTAIVESGRPVVAVSQGTVDNNARIAHRRLGVDLRTEQPKPGQVAAAGCC